jgi:septum site-determining protein MinD
MGIVVGVISIKGGVGKTTLVSNLGAALANEFNKKVLLIDANFNAPNLGAHLGVLGAKKNLHTVLLGKSKLHEGIYEHAYGFHIMPASLDTMKVDYLKLKEVVKTLKDKYDVILLDSSPALNDEMLAVIVSSDELLVVSTPDHPTLLCTMNADKLAKTKGTNISGIVLNKVLGKRYELTKGEIESVVDAPMISKLPIDLRVMKGLSEYKPMVLFKPRSYLSKGIKKIAASIIGEEYKEKNIFVNLKDYFAEDMEKSLRLIGLGD